MINKQEGSPVCIDIVRVIRVLYINPLTTHNIPTFNNLNLTSVSNI